VEAGGESRDMPSPHTSKAPLGVISPLVGYTVTSAGGGGRETTGKTTKISSPHRIDSLPNIGVEAVKALAMVLLEGGVRKHEGAEATERLLVMGVRSPFT